MVDELRPVFVWHVGPGVVVFSTLPTVCTSNVGRTHKLKGMVTVHGDASIKSRPSQAYPRSLGCLRFTSSVSWPLNNVVVCFEVANVNSQSPRSKVFYPMLL